MVLKTASSIIYRFSKKYNCSKSWLWEVLEDEFNTYKGQGFLMDSEEIERFSDIIESYLAE